MKYQEKRKDAETVFKYQPKLKEFYNGFLREFSMAFIGAQAVESG